MDPLVQEVREIWDAKAEFWDARMGEGNAFQRVLVGPAAERLLAVRPGETVLEVACGNGVFARRLAYLGARVVATDFSQRFPDRVFPRVGAARQRSHSRRKEEQSPDFAPLHPALGLGGD